MIRVLASFLCLIILSGTLLAQEDPTPAPQLTKIQRKGYSIAYPDSWALDTVQTFGADIFLKTPQEDSSDGFSENVNVVIQELPSDTITLDVFVRVSLKQVRQFARDPQVLVNERKARYGVPYQRLVYTHRFGLFDLRAEQYYFVFKRKAFVVTCTLEQSKLPLYEGAGAAILESFRVD